MRKEGLNSLIWYEYTKIDMIIREGIELFKERKGKGIEIISIVNNHIPISNN